MATKAIHLEVVSDLTSDTFLASCTEEILFQNEMKQILWAPPRNCMRIKKKKNSKKTIKLFLF